MDTEQAWSQIEHSIDEVLIQMESERRKAYRRGFIVGLVLGLVAFVALIAYDWALSIAIVALVGVMVITLSLSLVRAFLKLDKQYKRDIMPILTDVVCPNAVYDAKMGVDVSSFFDSMIFKQYPNENLACEDGIRGRIGQVSFVFCEAHLSYTDEQLVNGKKKKHQIRQFDGMAFEAKFDKMQEGHIIATTKNAIDGMTDSFGKRLSDNTLFGRTFTTYATTQDGSTSILCSDLKQCLADIYQTIKKSMGESDMTISFYQNKMLILVPSFRNRFEAKIFSRLKKERVREDFFVIKEMGNLAQIIDQCL